MTDDRRRLALELLAALKMDQHLIHAAPYKPKPVIPDPKKAKDPGVDINTKIAHRSNKRYTEPVLNVIFPNGGNYQTLDWSLSGCRIGKYNGVAAKATVISITINHSDKYFSAKARVMWVNSKTKEAGLTYDNLAMEAWRYLNLLPMMRHR
jgi:hypothetical protein